MLIFTLKKEWYEKFKSGEKTIVYREVKSYWKTRLWHAGCLPGENTPYVYEEIRGLAWPVFCYLQLGYRPETLLRAFIDKVEIVDGKNTDLLINKPVYAIHLAKIREEKQ